MPRDTRTPPLVTDGVFSITGSSVIDASREEVWKTLLDFDSYGEWNPFVRKQTIVDARGNPHPSGPTPAEGKHTSISVNLPPTMGTPGLLGKGGAFCEITVLDASNYRVAWETAPSFLTPSWLLHAERWQILTEVEGGKTKYETTEVMFGPMAYVVKLVVGRWLKLGFQAAADGLKQRVESTRAAAAAA